MTIRNDYNNAGMGSLNFWTQGMEEARRREWESRRGRSGGGYTPPAARPKTQPCKAKPEVIEELRRAVLEIEASLRCLQQSIDRLEEPEDQHMRDRQKIKDNDKKAIR